MSPKAVIDTAMADLGYTESPPGSNRTVYGAEYGLDGQPWCVMALWYWFRRAGEGSAFFGGGKTASCGTLLRWYREQGLTVPVSEIQAGDIVILNFSGTQDTEHCGLVLSVNSTDDRYINTIEGNTTPGDEGSQDNGGCVALKHRLRRQVVGVCRPQYKPEQVDDWSGHHAAAAIRWGLETGLIVGYPDGSVRPDEPVPLWRLLTILQRFAGKEKS
ncbi:MAG: S-layer homology domain-containing protein [Oscillospiraceae bacterium]|nr:S-layer homology domain-containing protein [Oscillospiraceae bacterium]